MIIWLYIKQPLLNYICKDKPVVVIYVSLVYTKNIRGIVI